MRITAITQTIQSELRKVDGARKTDKDQKTRSVPIDRSEIPSKGQRLNETTQQINVLVAQVGSEPDIRQDKVAEVREKIRNSYYDSPEFVEKLATKLLQEFGLSQAPGA